MHDEQAEEALEALVMFNNDMSKLACNAFQLHELLDAALNENDALLSWTKQVEDQGAKTEEKVYRLIGEVEQSAQQIA